MLPKLKLFPDGKMRARRLNEIAVLLEDINLRIHLVGVLALATLGATFPAASPAQSQVTISITTVLAPPPLPIYLQPPIPTPGYLWAPGYWAWDGFDYYWVPGVWVLPPRAGLLWTPGYWGWRDSFYVYNAGYWGPHIGYYGGVVYGFGYTGFGYEGGYWNNGAFFYNRYVNNITNIHITNVYSKTVIVNAAANTVSYNGGKGGIVAAPTPQQLAAIHEAHVVPTANQMALEHVAHNNPKAFAKVNNGKPPVVALAPPQRFAPALKAPVTQTAPIQAQPAKPLNLEVKSPALAPVPPLPSAAPKAAVTQTAPIQAQPAKPLKLAVKPQHSHPMAAPQPKPQLRATHPKQQVVKQRKPGGPRRPPRCTPKAICR